MHTSNRMAKKDLFNEATYIQVDQADVLKSAGPVYFE